MCCRIWAAALAFVAQDFPALAQTDLPPAPDFYLDAVIAMSLAEQYADNCPQVALNHAAIGYIYEGVLARLAANGLPTNNLATKMQMPPPEETDAIILDMIERNAAAQDPTASFCTEALAEIDAMSQIGGMIEKALP